MIFNLPTLKDTLLFPSFPARLRAVRGDPGSREFLYEITMEVDVEKALYNDCLTLEVDVLPKKPTPVMQRKPARVGSARSFTRSTKTMERSLRKKRKQKEEKVIKKRWVDLTKYISNSLAKLIKKRKAISDARLSAAKKTSVSSVRGVSSGKNVSISANPLAASNIMRSSSPLFSALASQPVPTSIPQRTNMSLRSISRSFLSSKKDPGQIKKVSVRSLPSAIGQRAQSLRFTPQLKIQPPRTYRIFTKKRKIKFRIVIQEERLKSLSTYYLRARLRNDKNVKLEEIGTIVQHSKLLNDYLTPIREPLIEASIIRAGEISIGVKQVDKKAKSVRVFRRTAPAETGGSDAGSSWKEIIETPLLSKDDELRFKDEFATSRTVLYRVVALGENLRSAEDFGSTVLLPIKELKVDQTTALSAVAQSAKSGTLVKITVSDIPTDAVCVMVRRYDLTVDSYAGFRSGKDSGFTYVGSTPEQQSQFVVGDDDAIVNFYDKKVVLGREYRYVPVAVMKRGKEIIGTDAILELPHSLDDDDKISLKTPTPVVLVKSQMPSVSFSLEASFTDFGFGEVKQALNAGNQGVLFDKDVLAERSNFAELINFLVERENFVTGEVESFGVYPAGDFEDNVDTQEKKNVKPLMPSIRYGYRITALVRSAESLFPKLVTNDQDLASLASFQKMVGKFRNPLSLRRATLQSTVRQVNMSAPSRIEPVDPFLQGRTNVQVRVEVNMPVPKKQGYAVKSENRGDNRLVTWTYYGDLSQVDHFQVFATSDGGRNLLGTVHADPSSANFMFRHFTTGYSVSYRYEVHAIQLNYKVRNRYKSAIVKPKQFDKELKRGSRSSKKIVRL